MSPVAIERAVPGITRGTRRANIDGDLASEPHIEHVTTNVGAQRACAACDKRQL
jgi:hypothetical protein